MNPERIKAFHKSVALWNVFEPRKPEGPVYLRIAEGPFSQDKLSGIALLNSAGEVLLTGFNLCPFDDDMEELALADHVRQFFTGEDWNEVWALLQSDEFWCQENVDLWGLDELDDFRYKLYRLKNGESCEG